MEGIGFLVAEHNKAETAPRAAPLPPRARIGSRRPGRGSASGGEGWGVILPHKVPPTPAHIFECSPTLPAASRGEGKSRRTAFPFSEISSSDAAARERTAFIRANTRLRPVPHVPEIMLHVADEAVPLWQKTEEELQEIGLPPPFWAFAWAGGQALARYVLDNAALVAGKRVLDLASGSGLVAIAAAKAGAAPVIAAEIDAFAEAAIALNAAENGVYVEILRARLLDGPRLRSRATTSSWSATCSTSRRQRRGRSRFSTATPRSARAC